MKNMTASDASHQGLPMGQSHDNNYDDDDFDRRFPHRTSGRKSQQWQPKRKKKKGSRNVNDKGADGPVPDAPTVSADTEIIKSTIENKQPVIKTGKPNHQSKSPAPDLYNISEHDANISFPPAMLLQRQLSGSGDHLNCLDLSDLRHDWKLGPFEVNPAIRRVNLTNNNLREIPEQFLQLPQLTAITFASNWLRSIDITHTMTHLAVLEMPFNKITKFPSETVLHNLPALKKLILFNNLIKDIPKECVQKLASRGVIQEINLSFNLLSTLPNNISKLTSLSVLRLSNNNLQFLPATIADLQFSDSKFSILRNRLSSPPQEVAAQGFSAVKRFFRERRQELSAYQTSQVLPLPLSSPPPIPTSTESENQSLGELSHLTLSEEVARTSEDTDHHRVSAAQGVKKAVCIDGRSDRKRAGSVDASAEYTKSSQFKMIVVGHETAGKTSCIHCLTRTIVYATHLRQYGRLIGPRALAQDELMYEIELFPRDNDDKENISPEIVFCSLAQLELCRPNNKNDVGRGDGDSVRSGSVNVEGKFFDSKPQSTVGIDIDTWRPFVAHDFVRKHQEYHHQAGGSEEGITTEASSSGKGNKNYDSRGSDRDDHCGKDCEAESQAIGGYLSSATSLSRTSGYYRSLATSDDDCSSPECTPRVDVGAARDNIGGNEAASPSPPQPITARTRDKKIYPPPNNRSRISPPRPPDQYLVLSIWDFAGQEVYHAAHEAFFSERALYLVVWDMNKNSDGEMDRYVQFWIDLIQSRAPGSVIIVVATHADELVAAKKKKKPRWPHHNKSKNFHISKKVSLSAVESDDIEQKKQWNVKALSTHLLGHLKSREKMRMAAIENDLAQAVKSGRVEDAAQLGYLHKNRPVLCPVFPVSCTAMTGFSALTAKIISLSTPTKKNKNPFQLVDVYIPRFYIRVKDELKLMRRARNHIVTIAQLQDQLSKKEAGGGRPDLPVEDPIAWKSSRSQWRHGTSDVRDAISFLCSIGEVVWFPPQMSESVSQQSELTSDFAPRNNSSSSGREEKIESSRANSELRGDGKDRTVTRINGPKEYVDNDSGSSGSVWREVEDLEAHISSRGDISDMVFISPHWLIDVLKTVLSHHLVSSVQSLTSSMSMTDLTHFFGDNHAEHSRNGIVRWSLIEEKLMRNVEINSPMAQRKGGGKAVRRSIIHSLRTLMLKFNIIIPLDMSSDPTPSHENSTSYSEHHLETSPQSREDTHIISPPITDVNKGNTYFLVPALIDLSEEPLVPKVAPTRSIKLETTFRLENFLPPGLLQRIMSRTYFQYGNKSTLHSNRSKGKRPHHMNSQRSVRNCWKSAFLQTFILRNSEISVWVWMEGEAGSEGRDKVEGSRKGSRAPLRNSERGKPHQGKLVETQGTIHISVFGSIFVCQELLKKLNFYSDIVKDVLRPFSALCHVTQSMVCPVCSMEERRWDCGEFSQSDLLDISADLQAISKQKEDCLTSRRKEGHSDGNHNSGGEVSFEWNQRCRRRCPRQGCLVTPDYLVMVPPNLLQASLHAQSPLDQAQTTISFLMEEIVRLSSKPSAEIVHSVCKVGIGFCRTSRLVAAKKSIAAGLDGVCSHLDLYFPEKKNLATGAVIDILAGQLPLQQERPERGSDGDQVRDEDDDLFKDGMFIVTCEHFMCDPVTKKPNYLPLCDMSPVYLIGDQDHWLYMADLVLQGSDYPDGRHKFASKSPLPTSCSSSNTSTSEQYEDLDLDALNLRLSSNGCGSGTPQPAVRPIFLQESRSSNDWDMSELEKPPRNRKAWDVAAFKVLCKIKPTSKRHFKFILPLKGLPPTTGSCGIHEVTPPTSASSNSGSSSSNDTTRHVSAVPALCPMLAAPSIPEVEQTVRLISYQAMPRSTTGSVSICWGRINQILNRQILVNFYGDYGSSGGAVIDRDGYLVGILSTTVLHTKESAFIEPLYPLLNLLRSGVWK